MDLNLELAKSIKKIREVELRIAKEYKKKQIRCPVHLSIGQEAPSAALSLLIKNDDYSVSTHRGHAHYLAKGGSLNEMIAELYGKSTGCSSGKGGSMHLICPEKGFMGTSAIVGNSIPTGTGLAHAAKLNGRNQISVIHIGDGAIEEGVFYESLNYACLKNLPALYFCENNFYSVYSPLNVRQPISRNLNLLAEAIGSHAYKVNGNNPLDCYKILNKAINSCRNNNGPVFIEFETYRWLEHCGPNYDDNLNYRPKEEINSWINRDPLKFAESLLNTNQSLIYKEYSEQLKNEIDNSFNFALDSDAPKPETAFTEVYSSEK